MQIQGGFDFESLQTVQGLARLDRYFLAYLAKASPDCHTTLKRYRAQALTHTEISAFIMACGPFLDDFIATLYTISPDVEALKVACLSHDPIFFFKEYYVKQAQRQLRLDTRSVLGFEAVQRWLDEALVRHAYLEDDRERAVARLGQHYARDVTRYADDKAHLLDWCIAMLRTEAGRAYVSDWVSFQFQKKLDYDHLIPLMQVETQDGPRLSVPLETRHHREGFDLTDRRMERRAVYNQLHDCVYCHQRSGDFCSTGFPVKKGEAKLGLKRHALGDVATGCPLTEKISEMQLLKKEGHSIAALAAVMIDNPLCPLTGHRICNDCMKACIYQKQAPIDIPQIETRVLTDVLHLPWGVEIYDLLLKWNPLRASQWLPKAYNGRRVLVMGMGPAGITLAHHLWMEGCCVVGMDGLKIERLPTAVWQAPIKHYDTWVEPLDDRRVLGFGGVAEYGITSRWDKNFLKLVYLTFLRRKRFRCIDNVRLGGNITIEQAQALGFDHLALAVGAGLPRELVIPNSLAPGMYQASDFLMRLHLTGLNQKKESPRLVVQLPCVVIGGGLTAVDTATELQAYYLTQIEKRLCTYEAWEKAGTVEETLSRLTPEARSVLDEQLDHARALRAFKKACHVKGETAPVNDLIRQWGGVTLAYRRTIQASPAYRQNPDELACALREGIYYTEHVEPVAVLLDKRGHVRGLRCHRQGEGGAYTHIVLKARTIFVATGAKPNIAYAYEYRGTLERELDAYRMYDLGEDGELFGIDRVADHHCKQKNIGVFSNYTAGHFRVTFLGDTHPVFHGSVVKAMASGQRAYPKVMHALKRIPDCSRRSVSQREGWLDHLQAQFRARVLAKEVCQSGGWLRVVIEAPMATQAYQVGQFYRLQPYGDVRGDVGEGGQRAPRILQPTAIDRWRGRITGMLALRGDLPSAVADAIQVGARIALMGPSGARAPLPRSLPASPVKHVKDNVLMIGDTLGMIMIPLLAKAMRKRGYRVYCISYLPSAADVINRDALEQATDAIYWTVATGRPIVPRRPQDCSKVCTGLADFQAQLACFSQAATWPAWGDFSACAHIQVCGDARLLRTVRTVHQQSWVAASMLSPDVRVVGSVYGPMQCMLKGVCAQCLQWQIDPKTGQRTKAVFACSWQHQPLALIDLDHLASRSKPDALSELEAVQK